MRTLGGAEATVGSVRVVDAAGEPRDQLLAGEPLALEVTLRAPAGPQPRLRLQIRDDAGLLVAEDDVEISGLGSASDGDGSLLLDVPSPPFEFGRFHVSLELVADDGRLLHSVGDACSFVVYPEGERRGLHRPRLPHLDAAREQGPVAVARAGGRARHHARLLGRRTRDRLLGDDGAGRRAGAGLPHRAVPRPLRPWHA